MLEDLGHKVVEVHSAQRALEELGSCEPFDVVLTDHAMPLMTGLELAERISVIHPSLPIILASGYAEIPDEKKLKASVRLNKPFSIEQLQKALSQSCGI